jgi:hypothetical protein
MKTIEAHGTVDEHGRLHLDEPLAVGGLGRVRVFVLLPDDASWNGGETGSDEEEWLHAAARNPAFAFLADPAGLPRRPGGRHLFFP